MVVEPFYIATISVAYYYFLIFIASIAIFTSLGLCRAVDPFYLAGCVYAGLAQRVSKAIKQRSQRGRGNSGAFYLGIAIGRVVFMGVIPVATSAFTPA